MSLTYEKQVGALRKKLTKLNEPIPKTGRVIANLDKLSLKELYLTQDEIKLVLAAEGTCAIALDHSPKVTK